MAPKIHKITWNHHPRGINRPLFEFVLSVVLDYLTKGLGPHLSKVPVLIKTIKKQGGWKIRVCLINLQDGSAAWTKLFAAFADIAEKELKVMEENGQKFWLG